MKFNWGTGIVISFILFALSIAFIVIFPFNQSVELVTKDYYEKELIYQEQIDKLERTRLLNESIIINQDEGQLNIIFPLSYSEVTGEILFYRPADAKKDFSLRINADSSGSQNIDTRPLIPGYWRVKVLWNMDDLQYYFEKNLML
jgi:hypothetical protein